MITRWEVVCVLLMVAGIAVGWLLGHWRAYAECCDCCTCQTCTEESDGQLWEASLSDRAGGEDRAYEHPASGQDWPAGDRTTRLPLPGMQRLALDQQTLDRRHAVVLEPGPTIYPALAELAGEVMDEPESHREPIDSTFVRKLLIEWEQRYPIPVGAP